MDNLIINFKNKLNDSNIIFTNQEIEYLKFNYFDMLNNLSYSDKIKLIGKIKDSKLQLDLIEKLNILKDLEIMDSKNKSIFFNNIIDKNYVTEIILSKEIYKKINSIDFGNIMHELSKEQQLKILNDKEFIKYRDYLLSNIFASSFFDIINKCDLSIVYEYYNKYKNYGLYGSYNLCEIDPTKENVLRLKEILTKEFNKNILNNILDPNKNLFIKLEKEDFDYFLNLYNPITISDYINNISNDEKIKSRQIKVLTKELKFYVNNLKNKENRTEEYINFNYLKYMNEEEILIYLNHIKTEKILENINQNSIILDYIINIIKKDDKFLNKNFNLNIYSNKLDLISLNKYFTFFNTLSYQNKIKFLDLKILENEEINNKVVDDFKLNYKNYLVRIDLFKHLLFKYMDDNKIKEILENIDIKYLIDLNNEKVKYYLKIRFKEVLNFIKNSENKIEYIIKLSRTNLVDYELLSILTVNELFDLYNFNKYDNNINLSNKIHEYLRKNPKVLLNYENSKQFLYNLEIDKIKYIIEFFDINEILELFIKTNNKYLEDKIVIEFKNKSHFVNNSNYSIKNIIKKFDDSNQIIIKSIIDTEFSKLNIDKNLINKINLTYDAKIFLLYFYNENKVTKEKMDILENLINKNKNVLDILNVNLFDDDIFYLVKDFIPLLFRYNELCIKLIAVLKDENKKDLLVSLLNNLKQDHQNIIAIKLNCIINYLYFKKNNNMIDFSNVDVKKIENYILRKNTDLVLFGINSNWNNFDLFDEDNGKKIIDIENERNEEFLNKVKQENNIDKLKNYVLENIFYINYDQGIRFISCYNTSFNKIKCYLTDETIKIYNLINIILDCNDKNVLISLVNNFSKYNINDLLNAKLELEAIYNKIISNEISINKGSKKNIIINNKTVEVTELLDDFNILTHSTCAIGSLEIINNDYYDSWNNSNRISNDSICTAFMSELNLGVANVTNNGVMFGFYNLNNDIVSMAPYDIFSYNEDIQVSTYRFARYMDVFDLKNNIRDSHSEIILKRKDNNLNTKQPDCIIIFEEMDENIKENSIKAQKDFSDRGIDLPIIYINRKKVISNQINKLNNMLKVFNETFDLNLISNIISNYESLRCGIKYDISLLRNNITKSILNLIEKIKENKDLDYISKLLNILKLENNKFKIENGVIENQFDLLDDNMINELKQLEEIFDKKIVI